MKSQLIQCLMALLTLCALKMTAQVVPYTNIQQQVVSGIVQGSTPNNPNFYQWHPLSTTLQGVLIALEPTEVSTLFLEENNCKLQFSNIQLMTFLEASFDNAAFTTLHQGSSRQNVGWIDPPSSFLTLGTHKLKIRFQPGASSIRLNREYNIVVVPAPESLFGDNTQSNAPNGNQLTTGNILALYDNPTCSNAAPVLLAEGYDASNTTFPDFYRFAGDGLIQRLFDNGYKVYILNFNLANQDLRNNAAVYNSAIRYISSINGNKDVTASGVSMGGVIARYALAKAEADGTPLPITSFVSIDAPQQGATVDLDFQNSVKGSGEAPASLLTIASKQLLVAHAWDASRSEHLGFFNELNALNGNGYPKNVPTIGVACSRNVPNPNAGQVWLEAKSKSSGITLSDKSFTVKDAWAVAGSFLPTASTNIEITGGSPDWLRGLSLSLQFLTPLWIDLNTTITRNSHPTFIPFKSALDLDVQGVSKFNIPIQQTEVAPSFHDQIPLSIGLQLVNVLGVDITTIASNETYNFTALKGSFVRKSIQVNGRMGVNKNLASGSSLATTPEAKLNLPLHKLFTSDCSPVTINVESGGSIDMSDSDGNSVFSSNFTLKSGDIVRIKSGATLKISKASSIIVGSGAKLYIEKDANINLVDLQSTITVQSGGELIINDNFAFSGNGYFNFEAGNTLTLTKDWTLVGAGKNTRLINVGHNAKLSINGGRRLTIREGLIRKEGSVSNQDVMLFNNGSTFTASNVTFDDQSTGGALAFIAVDEPVDLDNSPTDMDYSFRDCVFRNSNVGMFLGGDAGGIFDFRNLNVEFINTNFTNCKTAYYAQHGWETTFEGCTILGGGIDLQRTYWLQMRRTIMRGTRTATGNNSTVGVKIRNSCHNWFTQDCVISDYGTGIDGFTDVLATDVNGNIRLEQATIQFCETALNLRGGADIGLLYMDCARILQNDNGIKGWDLLLMAHSRNATANIFTRPANNPNSRFFETIFRERQETDISLFGSYWDNQTPNNQTVNDFWRFYRRDPQTGHLWNWGGTMHIDPVIFTNGTGFANCGGIQPGVRPNSPIVTSSAVVVINGLPRDLRIQEEAAMEELEQDNLPRAIQLFSPIAAISNTLRDPANSAVRYFVDVARVMAQGPDEVTLRSSNNYWVPESLVEMPKETDNEQLMLAPNPANNAVKMAIKSGNYHLNVTNAVGQTIFTQNTEGSLSVDVSKWTNGIYLFEVTDKATNKRQRSKIVVQH